MSILRRSFLQADVFIQVRSDAINKLRSLIQERFHLISCHLKKFPIITPLPEFKSLIERTPHGFGNESAFHKAFIKVGKHTAML